VKKAADPLDEGLNLPFNWVLMLMAGGSWLHDHTVAFLKNSSGGLIVLRGARVTADVTNLMAVLAIKANDCSAALRNVEPDLSLTNIAWRNPLNKSLKKKKPLYPRTEMGLMVP
jgi:hypothetical protein